MRGEGRIGMIIGFLVLLLIGHVLLKVVPVRIQRAEFRQHVEEQMLHVAVKKMTDDAFVEDLMKYASEHEIPLEENGIRFENTKEEVRVDIQYTVVLSMVWGEWAQNMTIEEVLPKFS